MTTKTTYNGWTNYETWCVFTWISNDPCGMEYVGELKEQTSDVAELAEMLGGWMTCNNPVEDGTMWGDLITTCLGRVNWIELAEAFLED